MGIYRHLVSKLDTTLPRGDVYVQLFNDAADSPAIELVFSGKESHNIESVDECYHPPLRRVYRLARTNYPSHDPDTVLRHVSKSIDDSMCPGGTVPTFAV